MDLEQVLQLSRQADISDFVRKQAAFAKGDFSNLEVPYERVVNFNHQKDIVENIGLNAFE